MGHIVSKHLHHLHISGKWHMEATQLNSPKDCGIVCEIAIRSDNSACLVAASGDPFTLLHL